MMGNLEKVLAEEWSVSRDDERDNWRLDIPFMWDGVSGTMCLVMRQEQATVAALGKRALAKLIEYEWGGGNSVRWCPECEASPDLGGGQSHLSDCELGKIVAAAKGLDK